MANPIDLLEPCDLVFIRDWTPFSWLIRLIQGDFSFSHVCLAGEGVFCLYSTGAKNLLWFGRIDDIEKYFIGKKIAIGRYQGLTFDQKTKILNWCHEQVGKNRYPLFKLLGLMARGLTGRMVHGSQENPSEEVNTYCAESVALAYQAAGITLDDKDKIAPDAETPEEEWHDGNIKIVYVSP